MAAATEAEIIAGAAVQQQAQEAVAVPALFHAPPRLLAHAQAVAEQVAALAAVAAAPVGQGVAHVILWKDAAAGISALLSLLLAAVFARKQKVWVQM